MQFTAMPRRLHPHRQLGEKFLQNDVLVHADHRVIGSRHPRVCLVRSPVRQDSRIGCWNMRVRADHRRNAPVEIPSHCHFLAGQLRVKIDEADLYLGRQGGEQRVGFSKRTIRRGHVCAPLEIENRAVDAVARLGDDHAAPGEVFNVICRTQQPRLAGEIIVDLALVPDVIAAGQDVETVSEQVLGELRSNAESARGVFRIGDRQIDFFRRNDLFEMPRDKVPADGAENIADKK